MAVRVADKIKQLNDGSFKLLDYEDIDHAPFKSLDPNTLGVDDDGVLSVISGGSGTTVIANPTLVGTEDNLEGIQIGNEKFKVEGGETMQYSNVPEPSAELLNRIIQYVGETNENFINGYFYKCEHFEITEDRTATYDERITINIDQTVTVTGNTGVYRFYKNDINLGDNKTDVPVVVGDIIYIWHWDGSGATLHYKTLTSSGYKWVCKGTTIPTYTMAEYEAIKDDIPTGALFNIEDDKIQVTNVGTNKYSTDEIICGEWIDGKPIYRKVISVNTEISLSAGVWTTLNEIFLLNVEHIVSSCVSDIGANTFRGGFDIQINDLGNLMIIYWRNNKFINGLDFILEYTKTTD